MAPVSSASKFRLGRLTKSPRLRVLAVFAVMTAYYWLLATELTGDFSRPARYEAAFDELGESILRGDAIVTRATAGTEAFLFNGKSSIYFGPFPALLRVALNTVAPAWHGSWGRVSCLLAALLCGIGVFKFFSSMLERSVSDDRAARKLGAAMGGAVVFGSPLTFIIAIPSIWHEAILWGLAASIWALYYVTLPLSARSCLGFSIGTGVALLSRLTFAMPLLLVGVVQLFRVWRSQDDGRGRPLPASEAGSKKAVLRQLVLLCFPVMCASLFQGWYNYARYDSPLKFYRGTPRAEIVQSGGLFNVSRLPYTVAKYFGTGAGRLSVKAPFIWPTTADARPPAHFPSYHEPVLSLLYLSPGILIAAVIGMILLMKIPDTFSRTVLLCLAVQPVLILLYYFVTLRFTADFLPFLIFAAGVAVANAGRIPLVLQRVVMTLTGLSLVTTPLIIFSTLAIIGWGLTVEYKTSIILRINSINRALGVIPPSTALDPHPVRTPAAPSPPSAAIDIPLSGAPMAFSSAEWYRVEQ